MNGVIGVGQFCEVHGPCLVFCTQTVLDQNERIDEFELDEDDKTQQSSCAGCSSIGIGQAMHTEDPETTGVNFLSTQLPRKKLLRRYLKQSCVRSLSCEIGANTKSEDSCVMCFCDAERGGYTVLCHTWRVPDSQARGLHRWITIVLLMKDRFMLMTTWPFFVKHVEELSQYLQSEAKKVYELEQTNENIRASRLKSGRAPTCAPRSIAQLTGCSDIWNLFHSRFSWILHNAPKTLQEVPIPLNVSKIPKMVESNKSYLDLANKLTGDQFVGLIHSLSIGIQVVLRGDECEGAEYINLLSNLLPYGKFFLNGASSYISECCLLAVSLQVALPKSSEDIYRVEMLHDGWVIKWEGIPPDKINKFAAAIVKAVVNDKLNLKTLNAHIRSLVLQWYNAAKTLKRTGSNWSGNKSLLRILGVGDEDMAMISYWIASID